VLKEVDWKGKKVLDAGCGTGRVAFAISKLGGNVLGIDYSQEAIKIAKRRYQAPHLRFQCLDIRHVEKIGETFDVILLLGVLEHINKLSAILKMLKKMLNDKGIIIATCPYFLNLRGYILMTLYHLFDVPITRTDLHYLTPFDFSSWAKKFRMKMNWRTFDYDRGWGKTMITDLEDRLPKALRQAKMSREKVPRLIGWLKKVTMLTSKARENGAMALYRLEKIR